ncbi:MAG: carboxylating nicotinate-nucleotide diphosphorylase [Candidatus Lokiarchaeota archaeon]|nr:carboxylating nicotinate-nucleotide diphosphorylase [Candidatus Lokiarchaeota archaeon]
MEIYKELLKEKLISFLKEDINYGDITTNLLITDEKNIKAAVISDEFGIIAGIQEAKLLCEIMNLKYNTLLKDGAQVKRNTKIMEIIGKAKSILTVERTLINIMMRMSGIASITNSLVKSVKKVNPNIRIACTRKTTPGFRYFEKRAVEIGGGDTHRYRLDDMVLIKDNHLLCIDNFTNQIKRLKKDLSFSKKIELEVKSEKEALEGATLEIDILMLDNFNPGKASQVIEKLKQKNIRDKLLIEISGDITPENIIKYAKLDVDIISMGFITHSTKALGMSLDIIE